MQLCWYFRYACMKAELGISDILVQIRIRTSDWIRIRIQLWMQLLSLLT
jgi:hypothetical protein